MVKKVHEFTHLDFSNYTKVEHGYLVIPRPDEKYRILPDVYARICSVIHFAAKIGAKPDHGWIDNNALSEAMTRGALNEFVALDDYIFKTYGQRLWLNEHRNTDPIFHMLKLLRNYNVHVSSSKIGSHPMQITLRFDLDTEYTINKFFISNLEIDGLSRLDNVHKHRSLLPQMIEVFNQAQHVWGIDNLIIKCTLDNTACLDVLLPPSATS